MHVLDLAPLDGSDPVANHEVIERELASHDPRLAALPRILALSKADLVPPEDAELAAAGWRERVDAPVLVTSSATRQGLAELARELLRRVPVAEPAALEAGEDEVAEFQVFRPAAKRSFDVERRDDGGFRVVGEAVDRLIARHDLENEEALAHVEHRLRRLGVVAALEARGFESGDDVEIGGVEFELLQRRRGERGARLRRRYGLANRTACPRTTCLFRVEKWIDWKSTKLNISVQGETSMISCWDFVPSAQLP